MSDNITAWKLKKIRALKIPVESFFISKWTDWHPKKEYDEGGLLTLIFIDSYIAGKVTKGTLEVTDIKIYGEGSGTSMNLIIEPALKASKGELIAICIWEGGDLVNKLIVKDSNVKWEEVKLH